MFVYKSLPYSSTLGSSEPRNLVWLDWLVSPLLEFILVEQTYWHYKGYIGTVYLVLVYLIITWPRDHFGL